DLGLLFVISSSSFVIGSSFWLRDSSFPGGTSASLPLSFRPSGEREPNHAAWDLHERGAVGGSPPGGVGLRRGVGAGTAPGDRAGRTVGRVAAGAGVGPAGPRGEHARPRLAEDHR